MVAASPNPPELDVTPGRARAHGPFARKLGLAAVAGTGKANIRN